MKKATFWLMPFVLALLTFSNVSMSADGIYTNPSFVFDISVASYSESVPIPGANVAVAKNGAVDNCSGCHIDKEMKSYQTGKVNDNAESLVYSSVLAKSEVGWRMYSFKTGT